MVADTRNPTDTDDGMRVELTSSRHRSLVCLVGVLAILAAAAHAGPVSPTVPSTPEEKAAPSFTAPANPSQTETTEAVGVESDPQVSPVREPVFRPGIELLGVEIPPASSRRLSWSVSETIEGLEVPAPVLVVNGAEPGPTLCLTAAIHGDELNGVEIVRRIIHHLDPATVNGVIIGVPIVNIQGFNRSSRYLPDRRDLNRYFPGNPNGSSASRIAHSLFTKIVAHCSLLVDLHTGSFHRTNLTQIRADLRVPEVRHLAQAFTGIPVLHTPGLEGSLRRAATDAGIASVTIEAGEPQRLQPNHVTHGVAAVQSLLDTMAMVPGNQLWDEPEPIYYASKWVRSDRAGILLSAVQLGERVSAGELLGTVTDPITNQQSRILSPHDGRVLGMALNQVVRPGFAAFHIGIETIGLDAVGTGDSLSAAYGESDASDRQNEPGDPESVLDQETERPD